MAINTGLSDYLRTIRLDEGKQVNLKKFDTNDDHKHNKPEEQQLLQNGILELAQLQDKLYAFNKYSVLIIFQGMDAAGKDGLVKHVMSGLNPQGVNVHNFKVPTILEQSHDFLWRHYIALPARGEIVIFNRSHYENVLITRVHPEYIMRENIPGIDEVKKIGQTFWESRFKQINGFEKTLASNGTLILKFFLHLSKKEQKKRFLERIENPKKNWKFSLDDIKERAFWKDYRKAYEDMLSNTSQPHAPWFIIPADDKWFARLAISTIVCNELQKLDLSYPRMDPAQSVELAKAKEQLLMEKSTEKDNQEEE